MTDIEKFEMYRSMIRSEDEQIHRRLSWLGTFQGFLFAALGLSWSKNSKFSLIICLLGLVVALLIFVGIFIAALAVRQTRILWLKHKPRNHNELDIFGFYPRWARFTHFLSPELLLPIAFAAAWIGVLSITELAPNATPTQETPATHHAVQQTEARPG